ncbi:MAG TPA: replication-associated recombination protein A [Saprospiraceae bacterium]|nr:replication-associated recombination protein A [Saprospiraceae bacterium]
MIPLAERMRPKSFDDFVGQTHLVGKDAILRSQIEQSHIHSMIFWGPPGVGKTSLAQIIALHCNRPFYNLSAVSAGVKDVREMIQKAESQRFMNHGSAVLFIDEIHRFNKSQQDALLAAVEKGIIILIGATTENPSFEVNSALLSRSQVYVLKEIDSNDLIQLIYKIISKDELFRNKTIRINETEALIKLSNGDARKLCNIMEMVGTMNNAEIEITNRLITQLVQQNIALYDKNGEQHYDLISAMIKSVRGSDPNAALYWMARMILGGEEVRFIVRRLLILAAEDIGLANPNALLLAEATAAAVDRIGWPESRILLSELCIYLSCSPKSNSAYMAIEKAFETAREYSHLPVPLHLRNAPTNLMKQLNYGKDYQYSHQYENEFSNQQYLPDGMTDCIFYQPKSNAIEDKFNEFLQKRWNKYK